MASPKNGVEASSYPYKMYTHTPNCGGGKPRVFVGAHDADRGAPNRRQIRLEIQAGKVWGGCVRWQCLEANVVMTIHTRGRAEDV
jgi:hypothetical protein